MLNNNHSLLLRSGEDNRYRRAEQLENGYFCGLVDRKELIARLRRQGARVETIGSNAHYALLRHGLRNQTLSVQDGKRAEDAFAEAAARDLSIPSQGWLGDACADHFMYRVEKLARGRQR